MIRLADRSRRFLIVNADDFGYFGSVSRGIIEAARAGVVTATAVMANGDRVEEQAEWLREVPALDIGVHLNATHGSPLTDNLRRRFESNGGRFPGKFWWARSVLFDSSLVSDLVAEWRAQIGKCKALGLDPVFLNSHEHVHMLPRLLSAVAALAAQSDIRYVRQTEPDWFFEAGLPSLVRNALVQALCLWNRSAALRRSQPRMFGLSASGRLNQEYIAQMLPHLQDGEVSELMCHPGHYSAEDIQDTKLRSYHDWEQELSVLLGDAFRHSLQCERVHLVGYRHLMV